MKKFSTTIGRNILAISFLICSVNVLAGNYTWNGATSTAWTTVTNWTPNGNPSTNDSVTIVTGSNNVYLSAGTTIKQLTINSGTLNLQSYNLTVSANGNFNSGAINNGKLICYGTSSLTFQGTSFGAKVEATGNSIFLSGSTFTDSLTIVKKGTAADNGKGNNTFSGPVTIIDSANGTIVLSDSFPDTFNSILNVINRSAGGKIYIAHRGTGNQFNGNVSFTGGNIYSNYYGTATYAGNITMTSSAGGDLAFGYSTGSCTLNSGKTISIGTGGFSGTWITFRNFRQLDTAAINLTVTGTARLFFESGSIFNAPLTVSSPLLYLEGTHFNNTCSMTNVGASVVTCLGGCYFGGNTTLNNNSPSGYSWGLGNSVADTFATLAFIQNTGLSAVIINNAIFKGKVTLKNLYTNAANDRYFVGSSGNVLFKDSVIVDNTTSGMAFGGTTGTVILDSTGVLSFKSGLSGNITLKGFTQRGNSSQAFNFPNYPSKLILGPSSTFNGNFTFLGQAIQLNGATFNGVTNITRYSAYGENNNGGNVFNNTTVIKDSSSHDNNFIMAYTTPDDFNGDVTFVQKGTNVKVLPSYTANSNFAGNLTVDGSSPITFGANGGKVILDGVNTQKLFNPTSNIPTFKKVAIYKIDKSTVILNCPILMSDTLFLSSGLIVTDSTNYPTLLDNAVVIGGSNSSFVEGFMKKVGNDGFVFPLGNRQTMYHPLSITPPASITDAFLGSYLVGNVGVTNKIDSGEISSCEYWKVKQVFGSSTVKLSIGLTGNSCLLDNLSLSRLAFGDSLGIFDKGNSSVIYNNGGLMLNSDSSLSFSPNKTFYATNAQKHSSNSISLAYNNDPLSARGLYVNNFYTYDSRTQSIDAANSILGVYDAAYGGYKKEDELLEYAQKNNFKLLVCYNFRDMVLHNITAPHNVNPQDYTIQDHFCRFIQKAKTNYCISFIGVAFGGGPNVLNGISNFENLYGDPTAPVPMPSFLSNFFGSNNPFNIITQTLSVGNPNVIAAEYYKTVLAAVNFTCDIDLIANEYEFWNVTPLKCDFPSGNPYSSSYCSQGSNICAKQPAFGCMFKSITENVNLFKLAHNSTHTHQIRTALYITNIFSNYSLGGLNTSSPTLSRSPYDNSATNSRKEQILILATDLTAKGFVAGDISSLAFNVASCTTPAPLNNFTISLKNTTAVNLNSNFESSGSTVYGPTSYTPLIGINVHPFVTPFNWDGVSNILIQTCFDNSTSNANNNARVYLANNGSNPCNLGSSSSGACVLSTGTVNVTGPNVMLNYNPLDIAQFVDGVTQTSAISRWDALFLAQYNGDSDPHNCYGWGEYPQIHYVFQDTRTANATIIHPLLNAGNKLLGDDGNYFGRYFSDPSIFPSVPLSQRNIFMVEKAFYDDWKADPRTSTSSNKNIINPGIFQWFMSSYLLHYQQNDPIVFQSNSPQCVSTGGQATIQFSYQGPIEKDIVCTLEVRTLNDALLWRDNIQTTPDYAATGTTLSFGSHSFPAGEYKAVLQLVYPEIPNCIREYSQRVTVTESPRIDAVQYTGNSSIAVCGGTSVQLQAIDISGTGTYKWKRNGYVIPNAISQEFDATTSGIYSCDISYSSTSSNCSGESNAISVTVYDRNIPFNIAVLCNGSASGVDLTVTPFHGGNLTWSTGATTQQINVTSANYYSVEMISGISTAGITCSSSASVTVTSAQLTATAANGLSISANPSTSSFCQGSQGSNSIALTGTSGFTSYLWSTNETTQAINISSPPQLTTTYDLLGTLTTSGTSCSQVASFTINVTEIKASVAGYTNSNCYHGNNGSITVASTGGTGALQYSINNGVSYQSTPTFSNLSPGSYTILVKDVNNCVSLPVLQIIAEPTSPLTITITNTTAVCLSGNQGTATVTVNGGTPFITSPFYNYSWSPSGGTAATASNLAPGNYTCTITDAAGCSATASTTIGSTLGFSISTSSTSGSCTGPLADGTAAVVATPAGSYTYSWNNNAGNPNATTATSLEDGKTYTVYVTSVSSPTCTASSSVTITSSTTYNTNPSPISTTVHWNSGNIVRYKGVIDIENGGTLLIENGTTAQFSYEQKTSLLDGHSQYYAARIVIHPGGKLILKDHSILSGCNGGIWDGIEMFEGPGPHTSSSLAEPEVDITGGTIQNAIYGIGMLSYGSFYPNLNLGLVVSYGGKLIADDATFKNNKTAIYFSSQSTSLGAFSFNQTSTLNNCHFLYDEDSPYKTQYSTTSPMRFVITGGTNGVKIANSQFTSNITSLDESLRGTGISGGNGTFSLQNFAGTGNGNNVFNNLTEGINIKQYSHGARLTSIEGNTFNNVFQAIYISGAGLDLILNNTFNVPSVAGNLTQAYGIHIFQGKGIRIEGNNFNSPASTPSTYGMAFSDCEGAVFRNNINYNGNSKAFDIGIQTDGDNSFLGIKCNNFDEPLSYSILENSGTLKNMGISCTDGSAAGNEWSYNSTCNSDEELSAAGSGLTYFAYNKNLGGVFTTKPLCISSNVSVQQCPNDKTINSCVNINPYLPPPPPSTTFENYLTAITEARAIIDSLINNNPDEKIFYSAELNVLDFEKIRESIIYENLNDIKNFYQFSSSPEDKKRLAELYYDENKKDSMQVILDLITSDTTSSLQNENQEFVNLMTALKLATDTNGSLFKDMLSASDLNAVISSETDSKVKAEVLLDLKEGGYIKHLIPERFNNYARKKLKNKSVPLDFIVYPNPASSELNISCKQLKKDSSYKLMIVDMYGKEVLNKNLTTSSDHLKINITNFNSGIYEIILFEDGSKIVNEQIIITR